MADIIRRNGGSLGGPGGSIVRNEWDPFRAMRDMLRWDPFHELAPTGTPSPMTFDPAFEIRETKEGYVFKADLPGVLESDLEVSIHGNRLSIRGKREAEKQDQGDTYYTYERSYGSFARVFTLPDGADTEHMRAELKDGVLQLVVPKRAELKARKIEIQSGPTGKSKH